MILILKTIYDWKEIKTQIPKKLMKNLQSFCTKEVHFMYINGTYQQTDCMGRGASLGSAPADAVLDLTIFLR